jgi:hypothetical protein
LKARANLLPADSPKTGKNCRQKQVESRQIKEAILMPLPTPEKRALVHTRVVTCHGFKREDNHWDIEGRIVDTKPYDFPNKDRGGTIRAGEPLHDMSIRLTIDIDLNVIEAEAVIDASPHNYCKSIASVARQLVGLQIAPGWTLKSKAAMGKNRGCTHLTELLGPVATTAIQTIASAKWRRTSSSKQASAKSFIGSCHSYQVDSPVVKEHWPDLYREKAS